MLNPKSIRVAAQPIIWSNDDFQDLGGKTSLETCLTEMREAGYVGTELGHKFPKDAAVLKPLLGSYGLALASGWHSTYLAERDFADEKVDFLAHLDFLHAMGSKVVIVAECTRRVYADPQTPLVWDFAGSRASFDDGEWTRIVKGLEEFAALAEARGLKLAYHHHMGTGIQNLNQIDRLMEGTKRVGLVFDSGHLAFAGMDPRAVLEAYATRVVHVHLKNVRFPVVERARRERLSFATAVRDGVFTVPGDGGIDYRPIFSLLSQEGYEGWFVVEAEQDPAKANPFTYAKMARAYLRATAGV